MRTLTQRRMKERGSVLVMVVGILTIMMLMAVSFLGSATMHRMSSRNMRAYSMCSLAVCQGKTYDKDWKPAAGGRYTIDAHGAYLNGVMFIAYP